jgi:hypothetical protein
LLQVGNLVAKIVADSPISSCSASDKLINILIDVIQNGGAEIVNGNSRLDCTGKIKIIPVNSRKI